MNEKDMTAKNQPKDLSKLIAEILCLVEGTIDGKVKRGYSFFDDRLAAEQPALEKAIENIMFFSSRGGILIDAAEQLGVRLFAKDLNGSYGMYHNGTVSINIDMCRRDGVSLEEVLIHEIMHAVQFMDTKLKNLEWAKNNILTAILFSITAEAGAETMAISVLHEMKEAGFIPKQAVNRKHISPHYRGYTTLALQYQHSYDEAMGVVRTPDEAVRIALRDTFNNYVHDAKGMARIYAEGTIEHYVSNMVSGKLIKAGKSLYAGAQIVKEMAVLDAENYMIDNFELPKDINAFLFHDPLMRQLCDFLEYERMRHVQSATNWELALERERLMRDDNIFMGHDLTVLDKMLKKNRKLKWSDPNRKSVMYLVKRWAKIDSVNQLSFTFTAPHQDINKPPLPKVRGSLLKP